MNLEYYYNNINKFTEEELINNLVNYFKNNKNELNDNIFTNTDYEYIIDDVKQVINNNINNYSFYVKLIKMLINDFYNNETDRDIDYYIHQINSTKQSIKKDNILVIQFNNIKNSLPIEQIDFVNYYDDKDLNYAEYDFKQQNRHYKLTQTKSFNENNIFMSYLCYFKSAVNMIINNPLFKEISLIETDTDKMTIGGYYHPYQLFIIGGSELFKLLADSNINIIDIVNLFNTLTSNKYHIGTPGIKYYPHQIFQELMYLMNNEFSNQFKVYFNNKHNYFLNLFIDIHKRRQINPIIEINKFIKRHQMNSFYVACPIYDNMIFNTFNYAYDKMFEINDYEEEYFNKTHLYFYPYHINNYYLHSFTLTEQIKNTNITFHSIYILLDYSKDKVIGIRHDNKKLRYDNIPQNALYMKDELRIFKNDGITDYIDKKFNYKITMLCYVKDN